MKNIYELKLHEFSEGNISEPRILRVSGGWIYYNGFNGTFVPYSDEFKEKNIKIEKSNYLKSDINVLGFSVRCLNALYAGDVHTLEDIINTINNYEYDLSIYRNFGKKSEKEILLFLKKNDLSKLITNKYYQRLLINLKEDC